MNNPTRYSPAAEHPIMELDPNGDYVTYAAYQIVLGQLKEECDKNLMLMNQRRSSLR